jgi:hypothetical protein
MAQTHGFPDKPKPAINMDLPGMSHGMGGMDLHKLGSLNGTEFDKEVRESNDPAS